MKRIDQVSDDKLIEAVAEMCKKLKIPGSIGDIYSLYEAVLREKKKALERYSLIETD